MKDFKKLLIWQHGMVIVDKVYDIVAYLPVEEKFGMRSQMTRSATVQKRKWVDNKTIDELLDVVKVEQKMLAKFIDKVGG